MKKKNWIWIGLVIVFISGVAIYLFNSKNKSRVDNNITTIKIASNLPMTGDLGFYGQYIKSGIEMAMSELKDSLETSKIKIIYDFQDNKGTAKDAVTIFNIQKREEFDLYMSGVTAQTMSIKDLVKGINKPHIIWSFEPFFLNKGDGFIRPWLDMANEGQQFIKYMEKNKPKSVAFLYQNLSSTQTQFNNILLPFANSNNIKVTYNEAYDISTTNFRDIITKVVASKPDIIIVYGFQNHLAEIIKGLNAFKFIKKGNVLCSFDFLDVQSVLEPKLLEGIVTNVPKYIVDNSSFINSWKERFRLKYKREPLFTDAYAYDLAFSIYFASKLKETNPDKTLEELILQTEFDGITGHIKYNENGQLLYNVQPSIFENGKFNFIDIN